MYKIIVIPTLLLLFVFQANNFLIANENAESKIDESIEVVAEAGVDVEAGVEKGVTALRKGEVSVGEAATTVTEVESKVEDGVHTVAEASEKVEEVSDSLESKMDDNIETVSKVMAEGEANVEEGVTALQEGGLSVEETAVTVNETKAKVEETKAGVELEAMQKEGKAPSVNTKTRSEGSSEAVEESETDVIATVNDEKIIRKDFDKRLNVFRRLNQDVTRPIKMQVIDQLTKRLLLKQFVDGQNIAVGDDEIQEELEKIKYFLKNNPNNADKSLEEILETQGSSITELEDEVKRTLALSKYLEKTVSDENKQSYFNANKNAFNGARVKASHILIDTRGMKTEAELEEAKKMIEVVKMEIDKGADFAEMAKKYSNCPSASKGGDIGFFQRKGSIVEEFAKVAFSMDVGEISAPVKTQFGYHIIKVTEKEDGQDVSYEEVADMVDFVFMQMKTESILKELYEKAKIEVFL